jgi:hypothetical protein
MAAEEARIEAVSGLAMRGMLVACRWRGAEISMG